jgi:hypothetical protein
MKKSSLFLTILAVLFILSLFASDLVLRKKYNTIDKSDPFWNYTKLNRGNFHHIKMTGGNITRTSFVPGANGSVGILSEWEWGMRDRVNSSISNDTLFVQVLEKNVPPNTRDWMKYHVLIAISCPDLLTVNGVNTNLSLYKMKQKNFSVTLAGRSEMEIETDVSDFDSLFISEKDTSRLKIEMSEDINNYGILHAKAVYARVYGNSLLDVGHFQIESLHQEISDSAAIILSGSGLKQIRLNPGPQNTTSKK